VVTPSSFKKYYQENKFMSQAIPEDLLSAQNKKDENKKF